MLRLTDESALNLEAQLLLYLDQPHAVEVDYQERLDVSPELSITSFQLLGGLSTTFLLYV